MSRLLSELELCVGSLADYKPLAEHHYRGGRPATATRVLVLRHHRPTAAARMMGRVGGDDRGQVVGVLVESLPALNCRLRDQVLGDRYRGLRDARYRSRILTDELRCISRVVIHPQWRGLGLAVRLVRASLSDPVTIYTEAIAAMGQVHPFFERAGMSAHCRHPHEIDARLVQAMQNAGFEPIDLARLSMLLAGIERLPESQRVWLVDEIRRWHTKAFRQSNALATVRDQLAAAQIRLLCQPVYYIHDRRESTQEK